MNILFIIGPEYEFDLEFPLPVRTSGLQGVSILATYLGMEAGANVVVSSPSCEDSMELEGFILVPAGECLKNLLSVNTWDAIISIGDSSLSLVDHPQRKTAALVEWSDWGVMPPSTNKPQNRFGIVARSDYHRLVLDENYGLGGHVTVIPDFVPVPDDFSLDREKQGKPVFLYPSTLDGGLRHVWEIWPRILEVNPDAELLIPQECLSQAEALAHTSFVPSDVASMTLWAVNNLPNVTVLDRDVSFHEALSRTSAVLYPCNHDAPGELSAVSVLYPLSLGVPVLCTPSGALEGMEKFGAIVAPFDPEAWVDLAMGLSLTQKPSPVTGVPAEYSNSRLCNLWMNYLIEAMEGQDNDDETKDTAV